MYTEHIVVWKNTFLGFLNDVGFALIMCYVRKHLSLIGGRDFRNALPQTESKTTGSARLSVTPKLLYTITETSVIFVVQLKNVCTVNNIN